MIFDSFWGYLPPEGVDGIGFGLFTKAHFTWLLILAVLIAFFVIVYYRGGENRRDNMRKWTALFLIGIEILKQCVGSLNAIPPGTYLPMEMCSFAEYTILIDAMWPRGRTTKQMLAFAFLPAAIMALVMPSSTIYPAISFYAIHQLVMHAAIVAYIIARYKASEISPRYSGIWLTLLIINIIIIPVYTVDLHYNKNYMYLIGHSGNTIIKMIWNLTGEQRGLLYIMGLEILVAIAMHITYGIYRLIGLRKGKRQ